MDFNPELKGIVDDLVKKYVAFISADSLRDDLNRLVGTHYIQGLDEAEIKFNMNFVPDYNMINFMQRFAFDNVQGLTEFTREELRKKVSLDLLNNANLEQIKKTIVEVMNTTIERAKLIAITESNRAKAAGYNQAAKDSGLNLKKQWSAQPERNEQNPCPHCEFMDNQIVELDEYFHDDRGEPFMLNPAHPRCKCRVLYIQEEDIEK